MNAFFIPFIPFILIGRWRVSSLTLSLKSKKGAKLTKAEKFEFKNQANRSEFLIEEYISLNQL